MKIINITINEGRDSGKTYQVSELTCMKAERWILRAAFGLGKAGVEIPPEMLTLGAAPIAYAIASQATRIPSRLGIRLADELMESVMIVEPKLTRTLVDKDIEDVTTRLRLKGEVLKLTFGFFLPAASQISVPPVSGTAQPKP
jgi:hypothetical protein